MTLPASGAISMSQVNVELGRAANAPTSLNDAQVRGLAQVAAGQISMSNLLGKTGRFDGVLLASGGLSPQISFGNAPFFGGTLNVATLSPPIPETVLDFNSMPSWTGSIKLINNTTLVSLVIPYIGNGLWTALSAPANLIRAGQADSFTVLSSN